VQHLTRLLILINWIALEPLVVDLVVDLVVVVVDDNYDPVSYQTVII